jgi:hypothetical protein
MKENGAIKETQELELMRTKPGFTSKGQPVDHYVQERVRKGDWRLECIPADVLGTARPLEVYRAVRKSNLIKPWRNLAEGDEAYCPAHWADIAIGSGACGLRCRACFLLLTHRVKCDPSRHVLYENVEDYEKAVMRWLRKPIRRNLGLGIDGSDSLLYEGVTGHVRRLAPLLNDPKTNPHRCKLILLTKTKNVAYLEGVRPENILLTFSLNPEPIADLWEGKWDDGLRITPSIADRLDASKKGEEMGFEVRWRVDPIFPVEDWQDIYNEFFTRAARDGHTPTRITLGTYRETKRGLLTWARLWGLPPVEWKPPRLTKEGSHYHVPAEERIRIYLFLKQVIHNAWVSTGKVPIVALCKETKGIRIQTGFMHEHCNCE